MKKFSWITADFVFVVLISQADKSQTTTKSLKIKQKNPTSDLTEYIELYRILSL